MGLFSAQLQTTNQVLEGARRPATIKTYVTGIVIKEPDEVIFHDDASAGAKTINADGTVTYANAGVAPGVAPAQANIITFKGGRMEFDGFNFSLDTTGTSNSVPNDPQTVGFNESINLNDIAPLLKEYDPQRGGPEYIIAAVPKYIEPLTKAQSKEFGVNYTVGQEGITGEFVANYHMNPDIELDLRSIGMTWNELEQAMFLGSATPQQATIYYAFAEQLNHLADPAHIGRIFPIKGTSFILAETYPQDNSPSFDGTKNMSEAQFRHLLSTMGGELPANLLRPVAAGVKAPYTLTGAAFVNGVDAADGYILDTATSTFYTDNSSYDDSKVGTNAAPGNKLFRIKSIFIYETAADAEANTNPYFVPFISNDKQLDLEKAFAYVTTPVIDGGLGWDPTTVAATAWEYYLISNMPPGHVGNYPHVPKYITREDAATLGLDGRGFVGRVNPVYMKSVGIPLRVPGHGGAHSALMWYADPAPLIKIRVAVCDPVAYQALVDTTDLWAQSGTSFFEPMFGDLFNAY